MRLSVAMSASLVLLAALPGRSHPDPLTSGKSTVDCGGVSFVSAAGFQIGGTIGQHDAGSLIWLPYVLVGGFWAGSVGSTVSVGGEDGDPGPTPGLPLSLRIHPPMPNPTSARTTLSLELPRPLPARVTVYDVRGARVRELTRGELPAGIHRLEWDGLDAAGERVGAGLYLLRIEVGSITSTQKVAVIR